MKLKYLLRKLGFAWDRLTINPRIRFTWGGGPGQSYTVNLRFESLFFCRLRDGFPRRQVLLRGPANCPGCELGAEALGAEALAQGRGTAGCGVPILAAEGAVARMIHIHEHICPLCGLLFPSHDVWRRHWVKAHEWTQEDTHDGQ